MLSIVMIAAPASAASLFSAPNGGDVQVTYFVQLETGITGYNENTGRTELWCNNQYGAPGVGGEWTSKCLEQINITPSSSYSFEAFGKKTSPNGNQCWDIIDQNVFAAPDPVPGSRTYIVSIISSGGNNTQMTIKGQSLNWEGYGPASGAQLPNQPSGCSW